jgi:HEPN domain-containing protein
MSGLNKLIMIWILRNSCSAERGIFIPYEFIDLELPEDMYDFVFTLNRVSVLTRYPDDLKKMLEDYNKEKTNEILGKSKELLIWLKAK